MKVLAAVLVAAALAGCSQPTGDKLKLSHVHGLAYDEVSGNLYLASHHGLARGVPDGNTWQWEFIGDPYDYMGFTKDLVRDGVFYSSGHPDDPRAYGGVHLGLRRSTDGGETWEQRSLKGQVDFHALTALSSGEGHLAGSWQGKTKVSRDGGATWTDYASPPASVLALGGTAEALFAATNNGLYKTTDLTAFANWTKLAGPVSGLVSSVAVSTAGTVLLAGTGDGKTGSTYRSVDGGLTWSKNNHRLIDDAPGQVLFAFAKSASTHAFAATGSGQILETEDSGASWKQIR
ncbi:MAG: hypothetical protein AABX89_07610 [Candidatus Thermoplasmatota archaeon]